MLAPASPVLFSSLCLLLLGLLAQQARSDSLPKLTLPWGTWQASSYQKDGDLYIFRNVRFGKAPIGDLRFAEAQFPDSTTSSEIIPNGEASISCIQVSSEDLKERKCPCFGLGQRTPYQPHEVAQTEDCLFLDMYIPSSAFKSKTAASLPVVVWFYGGSFIFGSKFDSTSTHGFLYDASGLLRTAKSRGKDMIYVVGNYRLGAFGWLAGSYMEKNGFPNAGLSDQRLVLKFVQEYIHLVGGDKTAVSVWGESGGASSILHHLIRKGGKEDPLFRKAILQSPAYPWAWDRTGALDQAYKKFAEVAGCDNHDISCLRKIPSEDLIQANFNVIFDSKCNSLMPFGPSVDGNIIQTLTPVAFATGAYWKDIETIIGSHVVHESDTFVPSISSEAEFLDFLNKVFPNTKLPEIISKSPLYASSVFGGDQKLRLITATRDSMFTGNVRQLYDAYNDPQKRPVYLMLYSFPIALFSYHALDLLPTYWRSDFDLLGFLKSIGIEQFYKFIKDVYDDIGPFSTVYQTYFISHAITGNPNTLQPKTVGKNWGRPYVWVPAVNGTLPTHVLKPQWVGLDNPFFGVTDEVLSKAVSDFWVNNAKILMGLSTSGSKTSSSDITKEEL